MDLKLKYEELLSEVSRLKAELKEKEFSYKSQHKKLILAHEQVEENETILQTLLETAAGSTGKDFFDNTVIKLSQWLKVDCVLIGQLYEDNRIYCQPMFYDGKISYEFSYDLSGSPCDITTRKGYCHYDKDVISQFPKDKVLIDMSAQGYVGSAIYNKAGQANGVICAVSRNILNLPSRTKEILSIIGARVSAEIERKKAVEALFHSEQLLRESNAMKDKLFSIIAHDLKSPLHSVQSITELLYNKFEQYPIDKQKKFILFINQTTSQVTHLLNNLLTWSLSQQGLLKIKNEAINLKRTCHSILQLFHPIFIQKSIELINDIPDDINLSTDAEMLSTIIRNLLSNALKFTPSNGQVKLFARRAGSMIEISIEDNGIGIEEKYISGVFNSDKNRTMSTITSEKGTGLGLPLCKEFVERLGGQIQVESIPGKKTVFSFTVRELE